jgi:hypothetical protein
MASARKLDLPMWRAHGRLTVCSSLGPTHVEANEPDQARFYEVFPLVSGRQLRRLNL